MSLELVCPKREELRDYALGQLAAPDAGRVRGHVEQCGQCRKALDAISPATMNDAGEEVDRPRPMPTMAMLDRVDETGKYPFLQPPQAADELGRLGNYRVFEVLGEGGMGIVFRAEDFGLKRPVALKVMRPEMKRDADSGHRFIREARTMAKIKHDHLVTVYSVAEEGDVIYFAMELLEGESLETWMRDLPPPDAGEIVRIGREIASGLGFIHRKKLIHRDIKPANIWLEAPNRRVKILDLGLARSTKEDLALTRSGIVLGTPDFMSPEQARGQEVDGRTDLFSLGCILYRLCTGRKPFNGSTYSAVLMSLATDTPLPPILYNPDLPETLSDLVFRLLARNPKDRPASAEAVVQALDEVEFERTQPTDHTVPMKIAKKPMPAPQTKPNTSATSNREIPPAAVIELPAPKNRWPLIAGLVGGGCFLALGVMAAALFVVLPILKRQIADPVVPKMADAREKHYLKEMKEIARQNWPFTRPEDKDDKDFKDFKEGKDPRKARRRRAPREGRGRKSTWSSASTASRSRTGSSCTRRCRRSTTSLPVSRIAWERSIKRSSRTCRSTTARRRNPRLLSPFSATASASGDRSRFRVRAKWSIARFPCAAWPN